MIKAMYTAAISKAYSVRLLPIAIFAGVFSTTSGEAGSCFTNYSSHGQLLLALKIQHI